MAQRGSVGTAAETLRDLLKAAQIYVRGLRRAVGTEATAYSTDFGVACAVGEARAAAAVRRRQTAPGVVTAPTSLVGRGPT